MICWFVVVVQWLSRVWLFATSGIAAGQASVSFTISQSLLKFMSIKSSHLILCRPFSSCLQSFPASGSFQLVGSSRQVAKVLKLQFEH